MHYRKNVFLSIALTAALAGLLLWSGPAATAASQGLCAPGSLAPGSRGCSSWRIVKSPKSGGTLYYLLNGVAAVSASDIWAVGGYQNASGVYQALIEHWDGTGWSVVAGPVINVSFMNGAAAVSASDIWAVGYYANLGGPNHSLIEQWDGSHWNIFSSPSPPNSLDDELNGVMGVTATAGLVSAKDAWAVGSYQNTMGIYQTLIERLKGIHWSIVTSPMPPNAVGGTLSGVATVSAKDVWAVGDYSTQSATQTLIEHWDGTQWSVFNSPNVGTAYQPFSNYLNGVVAVSATDVWAVGDYFNGILKMNQTLIEHWDGTQWSIVKSPGPGSTYNTLNGVTASSASDIWAVGDYSGGDFARTLIEHWDGTRWSMVPSPGPGSSLNELNGVVAISTKNGWAVGDSDSMTLIEQWNGTRWQVVPSPNLGRQVTT